MPEFSKTNLTDKETKDLLEELRKEMGLQTMEEVVRALARQAVNRATILCPRCGHRARKTEQDKAQCTSCMSPLKLAEGYLVALDDK